jgi:hypothetical protein
MVRQFIGAAAILLLGATAAPAQVETVVVTGERAAGERAAGEASGIFIIKRADHVIITVVVTCDTRDADQRKREMKDTLRGMLRAASATSTISLGIGDKTVDKLTEADFDDIMESDSRPDTSRADIVVKTTVSPTDTINAAIARLNDFVKKVAKVGRTEVYRQGDWQLTLIAPEQYRDAILVKIADDAKRAAALFGPGYGISTEGLEHTVAWYQKGPLDLALYIPYTLKITPAAK